MTQSSENLSNTSAPGCDLHDPDLMLTCATIYADKGWRVFPMYSVTPSGQCTCRSPICRQKGNHPIRPAGIRGATTRLRDILEWWEDDPEANIGLVTGSGLLVIAVTPERRGSLDVLPIDPIPQTGLVTNGDAGWHLYFTYNRNIIMNCQRDAFGPGIDIIAEEGYVLAPPSLYPSGQRAAWAAYMAPRVVPPKVLTQLCPEGGWLRRDYLSVLNLMQRYDHPLTPTEISQALKKDYSATIKLLRQMISDHQIYQIGRGLYVPVKKKMIASGLYLPTHR